jgi:hypothetical protein
LKKTAHIIYPFSKKLDTNPWSIGNNLVRTLKKNFKIRNYLWTSIEKIIPNKGDILIGHANSNPFTIFRRSIDNKLWAKKILLQPYNEDLYQLSYLYDLIPKCDSFLMLCGEYWFDRLKYSKFKKWSTKAVRLDLGINTKDYPFIKKEFNKKKERKFLYIGNDYAYNNYAKNVSFLEKLANLYNPSLFATMGNKILKNIKHYGWLDFKDKKNLNILKKYDFLIQTSKNDANPSTILEAISWGLIPVISKECGYYKIPSFKYVEINSLNNSIKTIKKLENLSNRELIKLQKKNFYLIEKKYKWKYFRKKVLRTCLDNKVRFNKIYYTKKEIIFFENAKKKSPNYYLNSDMIFMIIKSNISHLIKKIC